MQVLYVEDDAPSLTLVQKRLALEGIEVTGALTPTEGMELLKQTYFDALILDIMMPGIDGLQVGRFARNEGLRKDIPIILLSAHSTAMREPKAKALKPVAALQKPIRFEKLLTALRSTLPKQEGPAK
jgi:two-component system, OmpR family, response regulator